MELLATIIIVGFTILTLAFLSVFLYKGAIILFKVSVGSVFVGFTFMAKSYEIIAKKWWAWLIQLPILFLQVAVFIGAFMENKIGLGVLLVIVFQLIATIIIFNIHRATRKNY